MIKWKWTCPTCRLPVWLWYPEFLDPGLFQAGFCPGVPGLDPELPQAGFCAGLPGLPPGLFQAGFCDGVLAFQAGFFCVPPCPGTFQPIGGLELDRDEALLRFNVLVCWPGTFQPTGADGLVFCDVGADCWTWDVCFRLNCCSTCVITNLNEGGDSGVHFCVNYMI